VTLKRKSAPAARRMVVDHLIQALRQIADSGGGPLIDFYFVRIFLLRGEQLCEAGGPVCNLNQTIPHDLVSANIPD